ncbi:hypothetical protein SEA_MSCARN_66 [Gordonia phage MScarn]|uniref:Uncharacterized protein n=1 Tax=Gordonia phage MScarn TaxID=2836043 RepID=A0A8F3IMD6_9CAUD|nr:hypothetical protein SEA_MSCARN_66 [Gordonia phage MScarn]
MRVYKFKKKDFTLKQLQEVLNREALPPHDPIDQYSMDWNSLDQPVSILSTFTTIEVRVGK